LEKYEIKLSIVIGGFCVNWYIYWLIALLILGSNNKYIAMSMRSQASSNYWSDSKQVFFTPKLSLEGKNLFPIIGDSTNVHMPTRETPFLNILKKPIMSLYERLPVRS